MDKQRLQNALHPDVLAQLSEIHLFQEIDSTNTEALRLLRAGSAGNEGGSLILAQSQTAGRGRRGKEWLSPPGSGIYLSLLQKIRGDTASMQGLSLVTALSVLTALQKLGVVGLTLKWPNDVLFKKAKLAGILLELHQLEGLPFVVFGIGLNLTFPQELKKRIERPVTDLASIAGSTPDPVSIAAALTSELLDNIGRFEEHGFPVFQQAWNDVDAYRGHDILVQNGNHQLAGCSEGVDDTGALLLKTKNGKQLIRGGEIFPSVSEPEKNRIR